MAEHAWPARPAVALASRSLAAPDGIATIDILPLDLEMWAEPGYGGDLDLVRAGTEANVVGLTLDQLARHNYAVAATIDWSGEYAGGSALGADDLRATVDSLASYGAVASEHPGELPAPFLPVRLGGATGSDATLYLGGWAYVAKPRPSVGDQIGKVLLITVAVITVVALIAVLASDKKSSSHHGHHTTATGSTASAAGHATGSASGLRHRFTASRGIDHVQRRSHRAAGALDAFGRTAIDLAVFSDWEADPALPEQGGESQMYLEMTLVDNRTGLALWHVHQVFPADASRAEDVARAAATMLSKLPSRAGHSAGGTTASIK
jgi:hypothetical protein